MSLHGNQVFILFAGYARQINESLTEANCTSVLIKGKSSCIIVDTRTAWDGQEMIAGNIGHFRLFCVLRQALCDHNVIQSQQIRSPNIY